MKTSPLPSAGEVFTLRQYSDCTLSGLITSLTKNPASIKRGSWECKRLAMAVEESKRRGIKP